MGCLLGFIVFYPEIEGDGAGHTVPLSLAMELVIYCVCLQGREDCDDIPAYRSCHYVLVRFSMWIWSSDVPCGASISMQLWEALWWCIMLIISGVFMHFMYIAAI
jgi:hypothetical protein